MSPPVDFLSGTPKRHLVILGFRRVVTQDFCHWRGLFRMQDFHRRREGVAVRSND
jgi:hypothetical protein